MKHALLLACLALFGCAHPPKAPPVPAVRTFQLLKDTPEQPTEKLTQLRNDVEVDTRTYDRSAHVVATGESPPLQLLGARARLFGDKAGTQGFSVDNFLLFEVLDSTGKVFSRFAVGYAEGVILNGQRVDNVGRMAFSFEPGEIDITSHLPEKGPFRLKVTAIDYGGVGRVGDVWLKLDFGAHRTSSDDLRNQ